MKFLLTVILSLGLVACGLNPVKNEDGSYVSFGAFVEAKKNEQQLCDDAFEEANSSNALWYKAVADLAKNVQAVLFSQRTFSDQSREATILDSCTRPAVQVAEVFSDTDKTKIRSSANVQVGYARVVGDVVGGFLENDFLKAAVKGGTTITETYIGSTRIDVANSSDSKGIHGIGDGGGGSSSPTDGSTPNITVDNDANIDFNESNVQVGDGQIVYKPTDATTSQEESAQDFNDLLNDETGADSSIDSSDDGNSIFDNRAFRAPRRF